MKKKKKSKHLKGSSGGGAGLQSDSQETREDRGPPSPNSNFDGMLQA